MKTFTHLSVLLCSILIAVSTTMVAGEDDVVLKPPVLQPVGPIKPWPIEVRNSHLICRRAKNLSYNPDIKPPNLSFRANQQQEEYTLKSCTINKKIVELCVPATKFFNSYGGHTVYPWQLQQVKPQLLYNDFTCYPMKCKGDVGPKIQDVADQFGKMRLKLTKKYKVCVPAWKLYKEDKGSKEEPIIIEDKEMYVV